MEEWSWVLKARDFADVDFVSNRQKQPLYKPLILLPPQSRKSFLGFFRRERISNDFRRNLGNIGSKAICSKAKNGFCGAFPQCLYFQGKSFSSIAEVISAKAAKAHFPFAEIKNRRNSVIKIFSRKRRSRPLRTSRNSQTV